MSETTKIDLLKAEYLHVQGIIESFDGRVLTIKVWSLTTSLAGIGAAFVGDSPALLLISALSSTLFWFLEGMWKTFQDAFYCMSRDIEAFFEGKNPDIMPMQINARFTQYYRSQSLKRMRTILFWPHVMLPHLFVFLAGIILYAVV